MLKIWHRKTCLWPLRSSFCQVWLLLDALSQPVTVSQVVPNSFSCTFLKMYHLCSDNRVLKDVQGRRVWWKSRKHIRSCGSEPNPEPLAVTWLETEFSSDYFIQWWWKILVNRDAGGTGNFDRIAVQRVIYYAVANQERGREERRLKEVTCFLATRPFITTFSSRCELVDTYGNEATLLRMIPAAELRAMADNGTNILMQKLTE